MATFSQRSDGDGEIERVDNFEVQGGLGDHGAMGRPPWRLTIGSWDRFPRMNEDTGAYAQRFLTLRSSSTAVFDLLIQQANNFTGR